jgi:1,2-diacylglycerol 3-beta-galactosyltransferase
MGLMNRILHRRGKVAEATEAEKSVLHSLRSKLGIYDDLPSVLVVGGGDGMGGIVEIAKALGKKLGSSGSSPSYQLIVVCGKNEAAQNELSAQKWGPGVKVYIKGFVNNMDEWMRASDALVTKAGPGTIAEASICGLPCMLFAYL